MPLTLDELLNLPTELDEDHLRRLNLLPPPAPPPSLVPETGPVKIPPLSPVTVNAEAPSPERTREAAPKLEPLTPQVAPEVQPMKPPSYLESPQRTMMGYGPREEARKEGQDLNAPISAGPTLPATESGRTQVALERLRDEQAHPWGTPENHPGFWGKVGHVLSRVGNIAGDVVAPATMELIPGTDLNRRVREGALEAEVGKEKAEELAAAKEKSEAELRGSEILRNKALAAGVPGKTPEETTLHDLMAGGENGGPRKNPATGNPYTYLEAYSEIEKTKGGALGEAKQKIGEAGAAQHAAQLETLTAGMSPEEKQKFLSAYGATADDEHGIATKRLEDAKASAQLSGAERDRKLQRDIAAANRAESASERKTAREETRGDKSYQFNKGELEKHAKPIEDTVTRLGRLQETIGQSTPEADALVAPELLTVMAGGQGSGLRMNEAEIARIVGGRSHWEDLKAAVNKWRLDPKTANSITTEQRREIKLLVDAVQRKLLAKQEVIDGARNGLLGTDDPKEHRRVVADAEKHLDTIDRGISGKTYKQADVDAAVKAHPGMTAAQVEDAFKKKNWTKEE